MYIPSADMMELQLVQRLYLYNHILKKIGLQKLNRYFGQNLQKKKLLNVCLKIINYEKLEDEYLFNRVSDKLIEGGVALVSRKSQSLVQELRS